MADEEGEAGTATGAEVQPWIPFEDRRRARGRKKEAVLRMAVRLFLENGVHRTSLAEVAAALNITKPALYNYFRSKDEILFECCRLGREMYEAGIADIAARDGSGLEKLQALIRSYAKVITQDFGQCLVRFDDRELSPEARADIRRAKRRIIDELAAPQRPFIGPRHHRLVDPQPGRKAGQDAPAKRHHRLVIGKDAVAKEGGLSVRPLVRMDKRQARLHLLVIGIDIAPPEEHFLGVMGCRTFEIGKALRHPASLMPVDRDAGLRRFGQFEEPAACRHRIRAQLCRDTMPRYIEEPDLGRGLDERRRHRSASGRAVCSRQINHGNIREPDRFRPGVIRCRRLGHGSLLRGVA